MKKKKLKVLPRPEIENLELTIGYGKAQAVRDKRINSIRITRSEKPPNFSKAMDLLLPARKPLTRHGDTVVV